MQCLNNYKRIWLAVIDSNTSNKILTLDTAETGDYIFSYTSGSTAPTLKKATYISEVTPNTLYNSNPPDKDSLMIVSKDGFKHLTTPDTAASYLINFDGTNLEVNSYLDEKDFIVEVKNVKTIGQLTINCKGKAIEVDSISVINEDIDSIISDLEVETALKDKIASILFSNLPIKKKRIQIRKLKRDKLDQKFIKMFLRLLEYVEQI